MIRIHRESRFRDRLRKYRIFLDDIYIGDISHGEMKEFDIEPCHHTVYLKIDWCRSNKQDFDISPDELIEFDCGNSMNGFKILLVYFYITFFKNHYLWIKKRELE